jgi:diguanylate cyclase (GGDEF)-like protein/PAS domain S-box-containing protein
MAGSQHRQHRSTRGALRLLIERGHADEAAATASSARAWAAVADLAARLADADRRIAHLTEAHPAAVLTIDDTGFITAWNPAAGRLFGLDDGAPAARLDDLVGARPEIMGRPPAAESLEAWRRPEAQDIGIRARRPDGSWFGARLSSTAWLDDGRSRLTVVIREVGGADEPGAAPRPDGGLDPVDAEASVAAPEGVEPAPPDGEADRAFRELVEQVPGVVYRTRDRLHGRVDYVSPQIEALLGYTPEAWCGTPGLWAASVHPSDLERVLGDAREPGGPTGARTSIDDAEYRMLAKDGRTVWVQDHVTLTRGADGTVDSWSGILTDVTERHDLEAKLVRQAFRDPLTGLANRALFNDRMAHALARTERDTGLVGLLMIDVDDFKAVNDTLGHETGDLLLVAIADRLRAVNRPDTTIARLGGDEFAVLLENLPDDAAAVAVAARVTRAFERPFKIDMSSINARVTVGVAVDVANKRSASWLLRSADVAMYEAKRRCKGGFQQYDPVSYLAATKRVVLESELRRAVERKQFTLLYQPVVDLPTGRITGAEALIRWNHPKRGLLSPTEFVTILEATGMIVPVGAWVLDEACRQAAAWTARFADFATMAVNVSARQLATTEFIETVRAALEGNGLSPHHLTIEVTEQLAVEDSARTAARLQAARAHGVRVAVDDFGTGYSSLSYLRQLPVDTLKIDRSFVDGVGDDPDATSLARAILDLARTLKLRTVAEGIERQVQADTLRTLGCDYGQGYLFARPGAARVIEARLEAQARVRPVMSGDPGPAGTIVFEATPG